MAHTFVEVWETVAGMLTELDVLLSFAELAVCAPTPYVRPTMLGPEAGQACFFPLFIVDSTVPGEHHFISRCQAAHRVMWQSHMRPCSLLIYSEPR